MEELAGPAHTSRELALAVCTGSGVACDLNRQAATFCHDGREWYGPDIASHLSWCGGAPEESQPDSEATVQALSGLIHIHGREAGARAPASILTL